MWFTMPYNLRVILVHIEKVDHRHGVSYVA